MYSSVLVSNRGEIALRVISTLQEHGIEAIVTVSDADKDSLIASRADRVLHLPGNSPTETYLNIEAIVAGAKVLGVHAVHPGYGFLSENSKFSQAVIDAGIDFIGPTPDQMIAFGDKMRARELAIKTGTPLVPGTNTTMSDEDLFEEAKNIGFPVLIKASAGGGGRGIRLVNKAKDFLSELSQAKNEAKVAFNDDRVYVEKFVKHGRHIEVQVIGDGNGSIYHFGERDCSMQRKNQKLIEESPSTAISRKRASKIHETAVNLVSEINYKNAGTVEFLVDKDAHYFLEVNARIQVEHPVTEFVTGEDLIWRQIEVAAAAESDLHQDTLKLKGHAIEARINAENPFENFIPSIGRIHRIKHPIGSGVRVDSAIQDNDVISPYYDSMISKVIVHSHDRNAAIRKMVSVLDNYLISGVHTTVPFIRQILKESDFKNNKHHTRYLETYKQEIPSEILEFARIAAASQNKSEIKHKSSSKTSAWNNRAWGVQY